MVEPSPPAVPPSPSPQANGGLITFSLLDLIKWLPMVAVPAFGWVWHAENRLTSITMRVSELEEQVDNYHQTEQTLIEVKTRLEDVQRTLSNHVPGTSEKSP